MAGRSRDRAVQHIRMETYRWLRLSSLGLGTTSSPLLSVEMLMEGDMRRGRHGGLASFSTKWLYTEMLTRCVRTLG